MNAQNDTMVTATNNITKTVIAVNLKCVFIKNLML